MELLNGENTFSGKNIPVLIEFPEHFIINGHYYNKQTLKPIPLSFFVSDSNILFMTLQTSLIKTNIFFASFITDSQYNEEYNHQNIIQDKSDPSIFYTLQQYNSYDSQMFYKIKYDSETNKYNVLNKFSTHSSGSSNYYKGNIKILHETDEYFIISTKNGYYSDTSNYSYNSSAIGIINKKTFTYQSINTSQNFAYFLKAVGDNIYILTDIKDGNNVLQRRIIKINISSKIFTIIWTEAKTANIFVNANPIKIDNYYYLLTAYYNQQERYTYKFLKLSLDTEIDKVETEIININYNDFILDDSSSNNLEFGIYITYTLRLIKGKNNNYLSILMHSFPNENRYYYQHKHVLLKIENDLFKVVDNIPLKQGCLGSLINVDAKHQIFYMTDSILFYNFDETKEKMICTYQKNGVYAQIGFDSLNRFLTLTKDWAIEIMTSTNACLLNADFDKELYDTKDFSNLKTSVSFYAKNFFDEYIKTSVKLTLIGPVVFEENNEKTLNLFTSETGIKEIPVLLKGYGKIEVIIVQNT